MITVAMGAATGCAASQPSTVAITIGDAPNADTVALPGDRDAAVEAAVKQLPDLVKKGLETTGVPGAAVAVVSNGEVIYSGGFGVRDTSTGTPVDVDTIFQIASLSKPLSATVVAKAITDGDLTWDTRVASELPGFSLADPYVTQNAQISDYFAHRSGLPTGGGDDLEDLGYDRDYILAHLGLIPLAPFRNTYQYSNFGITVGAEAAAAAAGMTWEDAARSLLFTPLGMTSTSATHADFLASADHAVLHAKTGPTTFEPLYDRQPDAEAPAGGVSSNVGDIAKWMKLVLSGGVLDGKPFIDPAPLLAMTSAQIVSGHNSAVDQRASHYGFGINVGTAAGGRVTLNHSGAFALGAATTATLVPSLGLGIVVLTNGTPVGLPEAVAAQFLDLVQYGHVTRDWVSDIGKYFAQAEAPVGDLAGQKRPADPAPSAALADYAGTYANPYFGDLVVTVDGDTLKGAMGPGGGYTFTIDPWNGDQRAFAPSGENAPRGSLSSATFSRSGGSASTVVLEYFDKWGLGTFSRAR